MQLRRRVLDQVQTSTENFGDVRDVRIVMQSMQDGGIASARGVGLSSDGGATVSDLGEPRKPYEVEEHEAIEIPLSDLMEGDRLHLYPEVTRKNYFRVYFKDDRLLFQAGGFVGLIPVNPRVAIFVRQRVPVRNLERLIAVAEHAPVSLAPHERSYAVHEESNPSLLDLLARAFLASLSVVEAEGLYREYEQTVEDTSFPRGRILMGQTVHRHAARGVSNRITASWFAQSIDTAPNRCLKYAIWYLAGRYNSVRLNRAGAKSILYELNRVYHLFNGVELDRSRRFLDDSLVADPGRLPSIRAYYRNTINLASTIIRDQGVTFDGRGDDVLMASFLINMETVFESYLRVVLRRRLESLSPKVKVLDGNKSGSHGGKKLLFDEAPSEIATPDIVIGMTTRSATAPQYPLLIEVKYKKIRGAPERSDINQAISYATSYRAPHVVLAHPRVEGSKHGLHILGRIERTVFSPVRL